MNSLHVRGHQRRRLARGASRWSIFSKASITGVVLVAGSFRLFAAGGVNPVGKVLPDPPADEVRLVESIPLPPRAAPPAPPMPEPPPTITKKVFDTRLSPADLAKLKGPTTPFPAEPPPLGLSRLASTIQRSKFDVEPLDPSVGDAGVRRRSRRGVAFLDLDNGREWKRSLRDSSGGILFVSFLANASIGSSFDVGGALLRITASEEPNFAEIETGDANGTNKTGWKQLGYRVPLQSYDGRKLAQLPLLTLQLDRDKGTWDVFSGYVRVAVGLPLDTGKKALKQGLSVKAGSAGLWICGLVSSDENPLVEDINRDGVDDGLEWTVKAEDAAADQEGKKIQDPKPSPVQWVPVLHLMRPPPDSTTEINVSAN
jgi:hypothetical protein